MVCRKLIAAAFVVFSAAPVAAQDNLLYLTTEAGEDRLLGAELNRDYFSLASYLEYEQVFADRLQTLEMSVDCMMERHVNLHGDTCHYLTNVS